MRRTAKQYEGSRSTWTRVAMDIAILAAIIIGVAYCLSFDASASNKTESLSITVQFIP